MILDNLAVTVLFAHLIIDLLVELLLLLTFMMKTLALIVGRWFVFGLLVLGCKIVEVVVGIGLLVLGCEIVEVVVRID